MYTAVAVITLLGSFSYGQVRSLQLDRNWDYRCEESRCQAPVENGVTSPGVPADLTEWRRADVPGAIHSDLLRDHLIPDPFYRDDEVKLQWISDHVWDYRNEVEISAAMVSSRHLDLVFEGLDAYAKVYVNGTLALTADNQFLTWRIDVKPLVHRGMNELLVVFPNQDEAAEAVAKADPWFPRNTAPAKSYIRKAAYEHGWDWGPKFVTSGIWRSVRFESWNDVRLSDVYARQSDVSSDVARLTVQVQMESTKAEMAQVVVTAAGPKDQHVVARRVDVHSGQNEVNIPIEILHPELWYPSGYGSQPLYTVSVTVKTSSGVERRTLRIGLRSLKLRRDVDAWGRSFEFIINGIPIFAKGADVIPSDSFANRVTREQLQTMLQSAKDSNMNMVRLWGGGYYASDDFYDLCDQMGILIWHDFMFGNDWQPGTYGFEKNVEREAEDQLRRLRNHTSIVLWAGNNETEEAFHWQDRDKLEPSVRFQMWQDYLTLFHGVLAKATARFDPDVPYWPSSPSADLEPTSTSYQSGDDHIWDVWHGRVPFSTYQTHHARFVSEFGFQSFPEMRTIESFTSPEDRTSIYTKVMEAHQKHPEGNELIHTYMVRDYPEPKDFPSFIYASQVLQAEGVKLGAEHFRRDRPRTMGVLFWQLNDCWPVASWSSIDYFGRWKALQYYARRFYAPVLISPSFENDQLSVYAVSDRTTAKTGSLTVQHLGFDGTVFAETKTQVTIPPLASTNVFSTRVATWDTNGGDPAGGFIVATLSVEGEPDSRNLIYMVATKQITLPLPKMSMDVQPVQNGYLVRITTDVLARDVYLVSDDAKTVFEDNYFDLLPHETRSIRVSSRESLEALRKGITIQSLASAFVIK